MLLGRLHIASLQSTCSCVGSGGSNIALGSEGNRVFLDFVIDGKIEQTNGKDTITKEDVELQSQNEVRGVALRACKEVAPWRPLL